MVEHYREAFFSLRAAGHELEPLFPGARDTVELLGSCPGTVLGIFASLKPALDPMWGVG